MNIKTLPIILAGGLGIRLWPLSRKSYPKQFLDITNSGFSLLQTTVKLAMKINSTPLIIGNFEHRFIISEQLRQIGAEKCNIILESSQKNTLPPAIIGALECISTGFDNVMLLPSDHLIKNKEKFIEYFLKINESVYKDKKIGTFGIKPTSANTGYGYIEKNKNEIINFVEKPNLEKAKEYILNKNFLWNSGIFIYDANTMLYEAQNFETDLYQKTLLSYQNIKTEHQYRILNKDYFDNITPKSLDYGIMEKTKQGIVIECEDFGWGDIGEFDAIYNILEKDINNNFSPDKNTTLYNTKNSCIINKTNNKIVVSDINNALIVATQDVTMFANLDNANIKDIITHLSDLQTPEISQNCFEHRPWGKYENILESTDFKIKKITVLPQKQLSLQLHYKRSEHWIIVSGSAEIQLGESIINLSAGQNVYIPVETKHRVKNTDITEDLIFIEVQLGTYFGEDDIVRFEDNFGRV